MVSKNWAFSLAMSRLWFNSILGLNFIFLLFYELLMIF